MKTSTPGVLQLRMRSSISGVRNPLALIITLVWHLPLLECSRCLDSTVIYIPRWSASVVIKMVIVLFSALNKRRVVHSRKSSRRLASLSFQRTGYCWITNRPWMLSTTGTCLRTSKLLTFKCTSIAMQAHGPTNKAICQGMAVCGIAQKR